MIRAGVIFLVAMLAACSAPEPGASALRDAAPGAVRHMPPESMHLLPQALGWNTQALAEVADYVRGQNTTGFLIIDNERIIAEYNWPLPGDAAATTFRANFVHGQTADGALLEDVASQQKSFLALLAGIAVDRRLLDIGRPVSAYIGEGWTKATPEQEAAITVRHLLEMTSGLAEDLTYRTPAGAAFFYNTPAYAKLQGVLEAASGKTLAAITRDWLAAPLEMTDTAWRPRPAVFASSGNPVGLVTTPRDIAKMGQLVLDRGLAPDKTRVISAAQLDAMLKRTAANPGYSRLWWVNGGDFWLGPAADAPRREGAFIPAAPADLVAAQGAQDRKLFVVPSRRLIVVRTGRAANDRDFNQQLWLRLTEAMPPR